MRIAVIINSRLGLPALDFLIAHKLAVAVAGSTRSGDFNPIVKQRCNMAELPFDIFSKGSLEENLRSWLEKHKPDAVFVFTFPWLIPATILNIPKFGFINFHYAPLPAWRGRNPLFFMLKNGVTEGGLAAHIMNEKFDEGAIIASLPMPINRDVNFGLATTQVAYMGVQLTNDVIEKLKSGNITGEPQDNSKAGWYDNPKAKDLFIDWQTMTSEEILCLIRACNPWSKGAATRLSGWTFGITYASAIDIPGDQAVPAGTILYLDPHNGFVIACKDGKGIYAEVVYCEEGFYPGYCLAAFGLKPADKLE